MLHVLSICLVVALKNASGVKLLIPWHRAVPGKPEKGTYVVLARKNGVDGAHTALERRNARDFPILPSACRQLCAFLAIWVC